MDVKVKHDLEFIEGILKGSDKLSEMISTEVIPGQRIMSNIYIKTIIDAVYELAYTHSYTCYFVVSEDTMEEYDLATPVIKINKLTCPNLVLSFTDPQEILADITVDGRPITIPLDSDSVLNGTVAVGEQNMVPILRLIQHRTKEIMDNPIIPQGDNVVTIDFSKGRVKH